MTQSSPLAIGLFWLGAFAVASCSKAEPTAQPVSTASAASSAASEPSAESGADLVRPVYPVTNDPPDPLAQRFCEALHTLPTTRKGACCKSPPSLSLASECTRMLSYALKQKAVKLEAEDADRCVAALEKATLGCDWVRPLAMESPPECDGIVHGLLAEGQACRASLECQDGLRCLGSGPTQAGRCQKPLGRGAPCSHAVDTLAAYTGQRGSDARHPECAGFCARRFCADTAAAGGECRTHEECGAGHACINKKCVNQPLPEIQKPCLEGQCAPGARCENNQCVALGAKGAACERDSDCQSACVRAPGQKTGTCGMKCWASVADIPAPK